MRQYERSGVTVDQCTECRGIFLDRGELEKLFDAEANWNSQRQQAPPPQAQPAQSPGGYSPPPPPPVHHQPGVHVPPPPPVHGYPPQPAYGSTHHGYHGHYRHRKRKQHSFLNEFFG
jgi:Zn-finger nucleic acid-binding protein